MSGLRAVAHDVARRASTAGLVSGRLSAMERVVAVLANRRLATADALSGSRALRRRIAAIATDDAAFGPVLDAVQARGARGTDRALILAYLLHYPARHRDIARLRTAVAQAAERHDWAWRERGRRWRLWDGPETLAGSPPADRAAAGLSGRLADGGFARAVAAINRIASD